MQVRELKPNFSPWFFLTLNVAPHAGAWIETSVIARPNETSKRRTSCRCVNWNQTKTQFNRCNLCRTSCRCVNWNDINSAIFTPIQVAPHAGAWIETLCLQCTVYFYLVAPHAGAWIETSLRHNFVTNKTSRTSCRCVNWNIPNWK